MKLNYKRTLLVGFAFFLICTFWQAYDTVIPKILTDRYGLSQSLSGIIMALDNILAAVRIDLRQVQEQKREENSLYLLRYRCRGSRIHAAHRRRRLPAKAD